MEYGLGDAEPILLCGDCLNPCCRGIWSRRVEGDTIVTDTVLILVVVEYGLGADRAGINSPMVLILVVVEYGLGVYQICRKALSERS